MTYDKYYQTENLFGLPYPELMDFFADQPKTTRVLDLGCGQGRDAIPIARLGFEVTGMDRSQVGIDQMMQVARIENLPLTGITSDIYEIEDLAEYDFILLDSMFHFTKNDRNREVKFIQKIIAKIKDGCHIIFCIQDTGKKVKILNKALDSEKILARVVERTFSYTFEDNETGHRSTSDYRMIVVRK